MRLITARFDTPRRPGRLAWGATLTFLVVALTLSGWTWHRERQRRAAQVEAVEQARQREAARLAAESAPVVPQPYEASARDMLTERDWPWPAALVAIESVAMEGVTVAAIEMSASDKLVHLEVTFADHAKLLTYLESLNAGLDASTSGWRWAIQRTQVGGAVGAGGAIGQAALVARWQ
jgi:hypothetical protein